MTLEAVKSDAVDINIFDLIRHPEKIAEFARVTSKDAITIINQAEANNGIPLEMPDVRAQRVAESAVKLAIELLVVGEISTERPPGFD